MYDMCRCCQRCFEDIYWHCVEERFCYDESIANYNPDEDDDDILTKKNGIITGFQRNDNNNTTPVLTQPMRRECSTISAKIHEEDYRREIQTSVPILAPEILSVFANSQIFADHQPKIPRNKTKTNLLPGIHGESTVATLEINDGKLIKKLEDFTDNDDSNNSSVIETGGDKKIKFTICSDSDSPVELRRSISPQKFTAIIEEEDYDSKGGKGNTYDSDYDDDDYYDDGGGVVEMRSRGIISNDDTNNTAESGNYVEKKPLRSVQSVPYFTYRQISDNDIFSISGSLGQISMTPEVPSISYSHLPKNYIETPTIDKYKESVSLYSIQTASKAKALQEDYSMPRYFRMPSIMAQSTGNISTGVGGAKEASSLSIATAADHQSKKLDKGKRLKLLRGSLPPLLIHTVRHHHKKDDAKNMS